jgi:hypothetical protein
MTTQPGTAPESRFEIGEEVIVRKSREPGIVVGGYRANHIHSTFYRVQTPTRLCWPLTDQDLEKMPC